MAILTLDTLTGCSSIPNFLGGNSDTPANPTYMIFNNTNAPTSWTKDTTHNNKALRVIGGSNGVSISSGGSIAFTTVLSSGKTFSAVSGQTNVSNSLNQSPAQFPTSVSATVVTSTGGHTASTTTTAAHAHPYSHPTNAPNLTSTDGVGAGNIAGGGIAPGTFTSNSYSPSVHSHPLTSTHTHTISTGQHGHTYSTTQHSHQVTINENFSVRYVDIIIAKKS
jgi:hypothetical protein